MSQIVTRRRFIKTVAGVSVAVPAAALTARLADHYGLLPPDHGGLFGVGTSLTYASQRILTRGQHLAREFGREQISGNFPAINTVMPDDGDYLFAEGMTVCVDVFLFRLSWGSFRIENTLALTASGVERLTSFNEKFIPVHFV